MNDALRRTERRLVTINLAVIGALLLLAGAGVYATFAFTVLDPVDAALRASVRELQHEEKDEIAEHFGEGYRGGQFILVVDRGGRVLADPQAVGITDAGRLLGGGLRSAQLPSGPARVLAAPLDADSRLTLVVGVHLGAQEEALRRVLLTLLATGAGALGLAIVASRLLARRALVPIAEAFRRQQEFVADASHELRTPLAIMSTALDLLARDPTRTAADSADLVRDARGEATRMEHLVDDLLTLARADLRALPLTLEETDAGGLAREVASRTRHLAAGRQVEIRAEAVGDIRIRADRARVTQALLAITDNALRHTPAGGRITLSARQEGDAAVLAVADTGEGIAPDDLARVTDRFYRADPARRRTRGGAGLGLAIARATVEAHGGTISITSTPGAGTTVELRLPRAAPR